MRIFKSKVWSAVDIMFLKWSSLVFGAVIGAYAGSFVKENIWVFVVLAVVFAVKPVYSYWFKD